MCGVNIPARCVAISSSSLLWQVHGQHVYQAVVRVETIAGHYSDTLSEPYYHSFGPPHPGTVWVAALSGKVSGKLGGNSIISYVYKYFAVITTKHKNTIKSITCILNSCMFMPKITTKQIILCTCQNVFLQIYLK